MCVCMVAGPVLVHLSSNKFSTCDSMHPLFEFGGAAFLDSIISALPRMGVPLSFDCSGVYVQL